MTAHPVSYESAERDRPLLIAHVIFRFGVGGLENGLVNLINNMPADRYRHAIICLTDYTDFSSRLNSSRVRIIALHKRDGKDFGAYVRLWKILREIHPDFIHTRNLGTVDAVIPAALAGVRYRIHGEHGWDMADLHGANRRYRMLRRVCSLFTHRHITVSQHLADWLRDTVRIPAGKVVRIYNGVDTRKFSSSAGAGRRVLADGKFAEPDSVVIGTVGRMADVKNPLTLVRAFVALLENGQARDSKLRLAMIGDGPLMAEVRRAVKEAGIEELVWLPGERDDVAELLAGMDIFVMPSLNEGISNTILEAMATGLPVVATEVGGNPELVTPGRTGTLVPAGDARSLADGIRIYLDRPDLRVKHGAAGRQAAENRFSLKSMIGQYLSVYDAVAGKPVPAEAG